LTHVLFYEGTEKMVLLIYRSENNFVWNIKI